MRLVDVYNPQVPGAISALYNLLAERPRENWISHEGMPTIEEHQRFICSRPFRYWYLIEVGWKYVGAIEVTELNEIGIAIFREHQHKGYGMQALQMFLESHRPLPPIPAKRNRRWVANIAVGNDASKAFFSRAGFKPLQETYVL